MPPPRVIIDNEFVTLWYHTDGRIVHHRLNKPVQGSPFREMLLRGTEFVENNGAVKWLSDDRNNEAFHPDDSQWAINEWTPRIVKAGWRYWAIVLPTKALGQITLKRFINMYADLGVQVRIFDDPEDALRWLRQPDQSRE
jgi:hypothetical protein